MRLLGRQAECEELDRLLDLVSQAQKTAAA
jgi:hypothetical protein